MNILVRVSIFCLCAFQASTSLVAGEAELRIVRSEDSKNPAFQFNGAPFYPLVYSDHFTAFTPQLLEGLRRQGFNAVQVAIDTEESQTEHFQNVMSACAAADFPVILELNDWKLREELIAHSDWNMVMSDGKPVKYFPDYANPAVRREHLSRFTRAAKNIRPYVGRPIVAVSVGAYDAFHLPDGEVHDDFVVPAHSSEQQTGLPYGRHATKAFQSYLSNSGFEADNAAAPPKTPAEAIDEEHWQHWLLFRRNLVTRWLHDTVSTVRRQTRLPVGVSFDLNFAEQEQFATPPYAWSGILDFVSIYCYGKQPDARYVTRLMRTAAQEFSAAGVPIIGFLEFSSGISGKTPGDSYAQACAPFASGLMTAGPRPERNHSQSRIDAFIAWANERGTAELQNSKSEPADVLLVLDRDGIDLGRQAKRECAQAGKSVDVIYVSTNWRGEGCDRYSLVAVGDGIPRPKPAANARGRRIIGVGELHTTFEEEVKFTGPADSERN